MNERPTSSRVVPKDLPIVAGDFLQVQVGRAALGQIDNVSARLGKAVFAVVVVFVADQMVSVLHACERNPVLIEKVERDAAIVPRLVPAAKILA